MNTDRIARPKVSVIIPAYNEEKCIGGCLKTLFEQTYPSYEVIVVDDGSTDKTASTASHYPVKLVPGDHRGPGVARNRGAEEASGDILVFLDADMEFHQEFIEKLVKPIEEGKTIGTFSKDEYVLNYDNHWSRYWNIICGNPGKRRVPEDYPDESTVFRAISRENFDRAGGYDDMGVGEDQTVSKKLGIHATAAPGAICYHRNPETLIEVYREARWYARGGFFLHHERDSRIKKSFKVARQAAKELGEKRYFLFMMVFFRGLSRGFKDYRSGKSHVK